MAILQIGAGGVGWVVAHKAAQNNDVLGDITIASRTVGKCENCLLYTSPSPRDED